VAFSGGLIPLTIGCPSCGTKMVQEEHATIIVDHCPFCLGLWFDATELDAVLHSCPSLSAHPPLEGTIPDLGYYGLACPRCPKQELESAGWSTLRLARCAQCRGILVDAGKLLLLERADIATMGPSFEQELLSIGHTVGWSMLGGKGLWQLFGEVLDSLHRKP
jgi:Zn-finger nucleic acid-binding protein